MPVQNKYFYKEGLLDNKIKRRFRMTAYFNLAVLMQWAALGEG